MSGHNQLGNFSTCRPTFLQYEFWSNVKLLWRLLITAFGIKQKDDDIMRLLTKLYLPDCCSVTVMYNSLRIFNLMKVKWHT